MRNIPQEYVLRCWDRNWDRCWDHDSEDTSDEEEHNAERWGAGVETQKIVRGEVGGWGRVPFNEPYALSLSTIYDEA